jgi:hypothetical protein
LRRFERQSKLGLDLLSTVDPIRITFVIERQFCFIPAAPGELMLSMNDEPRGLRNNAGVMHVRIAMWPSTSIPRHLNLQAQECRIR